MVTVDSTQRDALAAELTSSTLHELETFLFTAAPELRTELGPGPTKRELVGSAVALAAPQVCDAYLKAYGAGNPDLVNRLGGTPRSERRLINQVIELQALFDHDDFPHGGITEWIERFNGLLWEIEYYNPEMVPEVVDATSPLIGWIIYGDRDREELDGQTKALLAHRLNCAHQALTPSSASGHDTPTESGDSNTTVDTVFIVHGHDPSGCRDKVARLVSDHTDYEPVILDEQPNRGRTLIEKFKDHGSEASVAIVLLTGDDEGRARSDDDAKLHLRARQNVILELGYFLGRLPPNRVILLVDKDVERPGDYDGIVYISLAKDNWRGELATELDAVGVAVRGPIS